jgi:DNA-binding transcriptional LysR family regulator
MDLDLNLLRVFDTLMELQSVTRAADRLGLTQSAVSHALGRLRRTIDDPLFVRTSQGLQPTVRATAMAPGIREGLRRLQDTLAPPRFEEGQTSRRFTIAAGSYFCALLIPSLIERARREAPSVSFTVVPASDHLAEAFQRGAVDLALGGFPRVPGQFRTEILFEEEMVWIAARGSSLASLPFDPDRIARRPRVAITIYRPFDPADAMTDYDPLAKTLSGRDSASTPEEGATVYDSQTAIAVVAGSDMVALVPRRMAEREQGRVAILGAGRDNRAPIAMLWHTQQHDDPGLLWLRGIMRAVACG